MATEEAEAAAAAFAAGETRWSFRQLKNVFCLLFELLFFLSTVVLQEEAVCRLSVLYF